MSYGDKVYVAGGSKGYHKVSGDKIYSRLYGPIQAATQYRKIGSDTITEAFYIWNGSKWVYNPNWIWHPASDSYPTPSWDNFIAANWTLWNNDYLGANYRHIRGLSQHLHDYYPTYPSHYYKRSMVAHEVMTSRYNTSALSGQTFDTIKLYIRYFGNPDGHELRYGFQANSDATPPSTAISWIESADYVVVTGTGWATLALTNPVTLSDYLWITAYPDDWTPPEAPNNAAGSASTLVATESANGSYANSLIYLGLT